MGTPAQPARIHLLPAKEAPYVVVVRRKPSHTFHIIRINTRTGEVEHGSWFRGKIYAMRSDVSFDGHWMVYLAKGANGNDWNGVCQVPFLKTELEGENLGSWYGGGFWTSSSELILNHWTSCKGKIPFKIQKATMNQFNKEDLGVLFPRLMRDGWKRSGENFGTERTNESGHEFFIERLNDDGWEYRFSSNHPVLRLKYVGYKTRGWGYTFQFSCDEYPEIFDGNVDWACYDCDGNLLLAREGQVIAYSLESLRNATPLARFDFEMLIPPEKPIIIGKS